MKRPHRNITQTQLNSCHTPFVHLPSFLISHRARVARPPSSLDLRRMSTISPFRYLQVARYVLQKWLNSPVNHSATRKGKEKAIPRSRPRNISSQSAVLQASVEERPSSSGLPPPIPVAGPSARREPLRPDPRFPPEPGEIYRLMNDERLLVPGAAKPPREIVVLCHGESVKGVKSVSESADIRRIVRLFDGNTYPTLPFVETTLLGIGTRGAQRSNGGQSRRRRCQRVHHPLLFFRRYFAELSVAGLVR